MQRKTPIHRLYTKIFRIWRVRRMNKFISQINPSLGDTILDVGGYPNFWEDFKINGLRIICLNQDPAFKSLALLDQKSISRIYGDGCNLSYGNQSFSVGFSNSVIEHVGDWANQKIFAREILRVGRKIWVQTPAYECPIEPHFLAPFFHWLPVAWRIRTGRWATLWGWLEKPSPQQVRDMVEEIRLLKKKEFKELFPDCEIITEKIFGILPKSYIAVRKA